MRRIFSIVTALCVFFIFAACTGTQQTGLFEKGQHAGTATILRVDDGWRGESVSRGRYHLGDGADSRSPRFAPLRFKEDIAGLDSPDRIVTDQDFVTIALKSVFIKYFKEAKDNSLRPFIDGTQSSYTRADDRKGEIAVVLSFSNGDVVHDSLLIYASEGQTLGSYLALDDWPVIGPIKMVGDSLMVRIVIIELDQIENARITQSIRSLANVAATVKPGLAAALKIAQPVADFLIGLNADDVIFDHRFALQRTEQGQAVTRSPLLYGRYVILLQEDKLRGDDVSEVAPRATLPPNFTDLRYDLHSDRLYKAYAYLPTFDRWLAESEQSTDSDELAELTEEAVRILKTSTQISQGDGTESLNCPNPNDASIPLTYRGVLYEAGGALSWSSFFCADPYGNFDRYWTPEFNSCVHENWLNGNRAATFRSKNLGYTRKKLGDFEVYVSLDHALQTAFEEAVRYEPVSQSQNTSKRDTGSDDFCAGFENKFKEFQKGGRFSFEYPVVQFPEAFVLLGQYPLHTHFVLSVDRSLGGGQPVESRFPTLTDFLQAELADVRDHDRAKRLGDALTNTILEQQTRRKLFKQLRSLGLEQDGEKICLVWKELVRLKSNDGERGFLSDADMYNEIFHITGKWLSSADEVAAVLQAQPFEYSVDKQSGTCAKPS